MHCPSGWSLSLHSRDDGELGQRLPGKRFLHKCVPLWHFCGSRLGKLWDLGAAGEPGAHVSSIQLGGSVVAGVEAPPPGARVHVRASSIGIHNLTVTPQNGPTLLTHSQIISYRNNDVWRWEPLSTSHGVKHSRPSPHKTQPLKRWGNIPPVPETQEVRCHTWKQLVWRKSFFYLASRYVSELESNLTCTVTLPAPRLGQRLSWRSCWCINSSQQCWIYLRGHTGGHP